MSLNRLSHGIQKSRIENAIVDEDRKLIYFWSEKCACTSVVTAVFDSIGKFFKLLHKVLRRVVIHYNGQSEVLNLFND